MPGLDGRPCAWSFTKDGIAAEIGIRPRVCINDALTINRLIMEGAGLGIISAFLCTNEIAERRLVHVLPEWSPPPFGVSLMFPSNRAMAPAVRAFVEFMKEAISRGVNWQNNDLPIKT